MSHSTGFDRFADWIVTFRASSLAGAGKGLAVRLPASGAYVYGVPVDEEVVAIVK